MEQQARRLEQLIEFYGISSKLTFSRTIDVNLLGPKSKIHDFITHNIPFQYWNLINSYIFDSGHTNFYICQEHIETMINILQNTNTFTPATTYEYYINCVNVFKFLGRPTVNSDSITYHRIQEVIDLLPEELLHMIGEEEDSITIKCKHMIHFSDYFTQIFPIYFPTDILIKSKLVRYLNQLYKEETTEWIPNKEYITRNLAYTRQNLFIQELQSKFITQIQSKIYRGILIITNIKEIYTDLWDQQIGDIQRRTELYKHIDQFLHIPELQDLVASYLTVA